VQQRLRLLALYLANVTGWKDGKATPCTRKLGHRYARTNAHADLHACCLLNEHHISIPLPRVRKTDDPQSIDLSQSSISSTTWYTELRDDINGALYNQLLAMDIRI